MLNLKNENGTAKDLAKAKNKLVKAYEEYKMYVEKYQQVRNNFEEKMLKACRAFQAHDTAFLQQLKAFFNSYARSLDEAHSAVSQVSGRCSVSATLQGDRRLPADRGARGRGEHADAVRGGARHGHRTTA